MLKLYKMEKDGCLRVVLAGEMDTITSVNAEREIGVVSVYRKVVLDMTDVSYVTSAGIRVLVGLRKRMVPDAKLELEDVQPFVRHVLELSGLTALIGQ